MLKLIIVEDEVNIAKLIEKLIKDNFTSLIEICGIANNTIEANYLMDKYNPSIALFDINIPYENAISFLSKKNITQKLSL